MNYITLRASFPAGTPSVPPTQRRISSQRWSFGPIVGNDDRTLAENLSRPEAEALIARLEARHGKPHKMHYEILEYPPKTKESAYKQRCVVS